MQKDRNLVGGFARGLAVIQSFDGSSRQLTLSQVAARAGVDRAVARRLLLTLVHLGFAEQIEGKFGLTPAVLRLGYSYLASGGLSGLVEPFLKELSGRLKESCSVAVLDGFEAVSIAHVDSPVHRLNFVMANGVRLVANASASARVMLAAKTDDELRKLLSKAKMPALTKYTITDRDALLVEIQKVRQAGYAFVQNELEEGLMALALPIRNREQKVVASLNTSSSLLRSNARQFLTHVMTPMQETASRIGQILPS